MRNDGKWGQMGRIKEITWIKKEKKSESSAFVFTEHLRGRPRFSSALIYTKLFMSALLLRLS